MKKTNILITGPNVNMLIHGGIVTHMKLLLSLNKENDFPFNLKIFTLGKRKKVGEKLSFYDLFISYLSYIIILLQNNHKIIHINSSMKNGSIIKNFFLLFFAKLFLKKCVFQFHGGSPADIHKNLTVILKLITKFSNIVLVLTDDQMKISEFLETKERNKIQKIPNFIESKDISKGFEIEEITFLFVGRIIKEKGIFEIAQASENLFNSGYKFKVAIMGDGPDLESFKEYVQKLNIEKHFIFYGFITDEKLKHNIYMNSHIMLFPSYYAEGFPYTILEAMQYSMPIISTGVGALSSVVQNNINGFIVSEKNINSLSEKMKYFLENKYEIKRIGMNSLCQVQEKYSIKQMKNTFKKIYKEI